MARISWVGSAVTLLFTAGLAAGCGKTADPPRATVTAGTASATAGAGGSTSTAGAAVLPLAGSGGAVVAVGGASSAGEGGGGASGAALPAITLLERGGGLGFCIPEDTFHSAKVEVVATGEAMLSGTVHRAWDDVSTPECASKRCEIVEEVEPFALTKQQTAELGDRIAALLPPTCSGMPNPICDPCLSERLTLDGTVYYDANCKIDVCEGYKDTFNAVTALIDSFAP